MKPTPPPYKIDAKRPDVIRIRGTLGEIVAAFPLGPGIDVDRARANAEAWIAGAAALEKIERIEQAMRTVELDNNEVVAEIRHILRTRQ